MCVTMGAAGFLLVYPCIAYEDLLPTFMPFCSPGWLCESCLVMRHVGQVIDRPSGGGHPGHAHPDCWVCERAQ